MNYIGIDVGNKGAICILDEKANLIKFIDMKDFQIKMISYLIPKKIKVGIEKVHSMPKQGLVSTFNFGVNFGKILGIFETLEFQYELINPQVWQREIIENSFYKDKSLSIKEKSILNARKLLKEKENLLLGKRGAYKDGRADAFNIAYYMFLKDKK